MDTAKQNAYTVSPRVSAMKVKNGMSPSLQDHVSFSMGSCSTSISTKKIEKGLYAYIFRNTKVGLIPGFQQAQPLLFCGDDAIWVDWWEMSRRNLVDPEQGHQSDKGGWK